MLRTLFFTSSSPCLLARSLCFLLPTNSSFDRSHTSKTLFLTLLNAILINCHLSGHQRASLSSTLSSTLPINPTKGSGLSRIRYVNHSTIKIPLPPHEHTTIYRRIIVERTQIHSSLGKIIKSYLLRSKQYTTSVDDFVPPQPVRADYRRSGQELTQALWTPSASHRSRLHRHSTRRIHMRQ